MFFKPQNTDQRTSNTPRPIASWYSLLVGVALVALIIVEFGFLGAATPWVRVCTALLVLLFALEQGLNWHQAGRTTAHLRHQSFHVLIAGVATSLMIVLLVLVPWKGGGEGKVALLSHGLVQGAMLLSLGLRCLHHQAQSTRLRLRPGWLFMGSFALIIILGTLLLKLPRAVVEGESLTWLDALFTSTSAVCVTGLAVENTAQFFTPTGQVILLCLIQAGGLGIMTLTFYLGSILFRGMSLHERQALGEMISEKHLAQVADSMRFIVLFTFVAEALGAFLIFLCLPADRGVYERVFQAVFHSVSAFCNAGFSTLPDGLADAWIRDNRALQLTIATLVILGGLGTAVLRDGLVYLRHRVQRLREPAQRRPRLRVHTRLVLSVTGLLLGGGAALIWITEFVFRAGEINGGTALTAFFHSVTARTAGFNTVDTGAIGPVTVHLLVFLMIIGGSPGGTAGGVRTTVFATAAVHLWNSIRTTPDLVLFRRRMPSDTASRALGILVLTMGWLFVNFAILRQLQPGVSDTRLVFELVSAFATVGLSMNLTTELTEAARCLIVLNMFVGRIGLITVVSTLAPVNRIRPGQRPTENIILA